MLREGDPLPWRKHDWPDRRWNPPPPDGHQASDSVLGSWGVIQGFDFGDQGRRFGRFDRGRGDGGQVLVLRPDGVAIALTEDGGNGIQWFQRPDCTPGGWLVADGAPVPEWRERVAPLRLMRRPDACPATPDRSLTRWRTVPVAFPWRRPDGAGGTFTADTLLSEHYSHADLAGSEHLERSWYARHLGLVRWERWEVARTPAQAVRADDFAQSGRCPPVAGSDPPGPGWRLLDCRMWTNFVQGPARPEAWPAARR